MGVIVRFFNRADAHFLPDNARILKGGAGYVDASINVPLVQVPSSVNRAEGDIHIYGNPHYWLDPANGKIIAQNLYQVLARLDPEDEPYFQGNVKKFNETMDGKIMEWTVKMLPFKGTKIIAYKWITE